MKDNKNIKFLVKLLKWVSLFFILKLFLWSLRLKYGGGGGWIDLSIGPTGYDFSWHSNNTVAILLLLFLYYILKLENSAKKFFLFFVLLTLSIFGKEVTYQVSPSLKFYFTDRYLSDVYKDGVFDVDTYLEYIDKYCANDRSNWNFAGDSLYYFCDKKVFKLEEMGNLNDIITAIKYADNINNKYLYSFFIPNKDTDSFNELIKNYKNKTFQVYLASNIKDEVILNLIKLNYFDESIINLINYILMKDKYYKENYKDLSYDEKSEYRESFSFGIKENIKNMEGVNHELFY